MSTVLVKGQNMPLTGRELRVTVQVAHPADISALLVTTTGKVRSDSDFVFFNQPNGPGVTCRQPAGGEPWRIDLDLNRVPADIDKVRVVTSLDGDGARFGQFAPPVARVTDTAGAAVAEYTMTGLDKESIVIAVEAYRRGGDWKLRAVGQGYAGGLADLVTDHGVSVDDAGPPAQPAAVQAPPPPQPPPASQAPPQAPPPPPPPSAPYQAPQPPPSAPYQAPQPPPSAPYQAPQPPPSAPYQAPQPPPSAPYQAPQAPEYQAPPTGSIPTAPFPSAQAPAPTGPQPDAVAQPGRPVNLAKGQRVSLQKQDGSQLTLVRMGLGWDPVKKRGIFGSRDVEIDLDASAVLFADNQAVDIAFFNHLRSNDGSVTHTGDNRTGAGEGDDESIMVELQRVPAHVTTIFFVVTSYEGQTFQQVQNAFCRLVDETSRGELARYTLSGGEPYTAMVMAKVFRAGSAWKMQAIGEGAQGKTALDLVPHLVRLTQ